MPFPYSSSCSFTFCKFSKWSRTCSTIFLFFLFFLIDLNKLEDAIALCKKFIDLYPVNAEAHYLYAEVLLDMGIYDAALTRAKLP